MKTLSGSETLNPTDANDEHTYADGKCSSKHSYDQMWTDSSGNFYITGGSPWGAGGGACPDTWKWNRATGAWVRLTDQPDTMSLGGCAVYDSVTNKAYICRPNNWSHFYNCTADTWSGNKTISNLNGYSLTTCLDTTRNRAIFFGSQGSDAVSSLLTLNFSAETVSESALTPTGTSCPLFADEGGGALYDSMLDCFWLFGGRVTTFDRIWRMNASTFAITEHLLSATIPTHASFHGTWKRSMFMSDWRKIGVAMGHDANVYLFSLPSV